MRYVIGIVIEEWKITSGILNQYGDLIQQEIVNTNVTNKVEVTEHVIMSVKRLLAHSSIPLAGMNGIGISVPDQTDTTENIAGLPCENPTLLVEYLRTAFKVEPIILDYAHHMMSHVDNTNEFNEMSPTSKKLIGAGLCVLNK